MIRYFIEGSGTERDPDLHVPRVVCDSCDEPIIDHGNAYWFASDDDVPAEARNRIWHTCKPCGMFDRELEARYGGLILSAELRVHLDQLRHNLKHAPRVTR